MTTALKYCINLSTLYTEHPFLDRFAMAARAGFTAVEYHFPYEFDLTEVKARPRDPRPGPNSIQPACWRHEDWRIRHSQQSAKACLFSLELCHGSRRCAVPQLRQTSCDVRQQGARHRTERASGMCG